MVRARYVPEEFGNEVEAPSGYYQPLEEAFLDHDGKRLLYIVGSACIDASCCGISSWKYLRVEGYVVGNDAPPSENAGTYLEVDTIDSESEKTAIRRLLLDKHPGVRIEFR